jgi:hypothetical protein
VPSRGHKGGGDDEFMAEALAGVASAQAWHGRIDEPMLAR